MNILCLSDVVVSFLHSPRVKERFAGVNLVVACGDLPHEYIEYVANALNVDCYYVNGNHSHKIEQSSAGPLTGPQGGIALHRRVQTWRGITFAGIDGSLRYSEGPYQYTQNEMWSHARHLARLLMYKRLRGYPLDVLVTHAPPWGINDQDDPPHRGVKAFRWLIERFQPAYHIHGHVHLYRPDMPSEDYLGRTCVLNAYGWKLVELADRA